MGGAAVAPEPELDRGRRGDHEAVRATAMAVRGEDDERPLDDGDERSNELLEGDRRDER